MKLKAIPLLLLLPVLMLLLVACGENTEPLSDIEATVEAKVEQAKASLVAPAAAPLPTYTPAHIPTPIPTPTAAMTPKPTPTPIPTVPQYQGQQVVFDEAAFDVELAVTPEQHARGLMGREHMGDREGMLFIYKVEGLHRFWMKGMVIRLDMVWIDAEGIVAGVTANLPPAPEGTIPKIYSPPRPILYVLEISAGLAEAVGIRAGSQVKFVPEFDNETI